MRLLSFFTFLCRLAVMRTIRSRHAVLRQILKAEFLYVISDGHGDVFAVGRSKDSTVAVSRAASQPRWAGGFDVVIAKFRGSDGEMIAATFLGGNGDDVPVGIALDPQGSVT